MRNIFARCLFVVIASTVCVFALAEQARHFGRPYDTFEMKSKYVDQTFEIHVSVPASCEKEKCPVIYFADADADFGVFPMLSEGLAYAGVPWTINVRVGYPSDMDTSNWLVLRDRDLLMSSEDQVNSLKRKPFLPVDIQKTAPKFGRGAPDFLTFLRSELIPEIENRYPVKSDDRTYYGFGGGSVFGLYTLFTQPDTFNRYVLGSGFSQSNLDRALQFAKSGKPIDANLFFSVGMDESLGTTFGGYLDLARILNEFSIPGLNYSYRAWPDEIHATASIPAFTFGMRSVFDSCKPYLYPENKCPIQVID